MSSVILIFNSILSSLHWQLYDVASEFGFEIVCRYISELPDDEEATVIKVRFFFTFFLSSPIFFWLLYLFFSIHTTGSSTVRSC
jgi:hypothetical protein